MALRSRPQRMRVEGSRYEGGANWLDLPVGEKDAPDGLLSHAPQSASR